MRNPPPPPSRREIAALTGAAVGLTAEAMARRYGTTSRTLRRAQARAAAKLGANGLVNAVALAVRHGWIDPVHLDAAVLPQCDWRVRPSRPWRPRVKVPDDPR